MVSPQAWGMVKNPGRLHRGSDICDTRQLRLGGHGFRILLSMGSQKGNQHHRGKVNLPIPLSKQEPSVLVKLSESMAKIEQVKRVSISNHFHLSSITKNESQGDHLDGDDMPLFLSLRCFNAPPPKNPCNTSDEGKGELPWWATLF